MELRVGLKRPRHEDVRNDSRGLTCREGVTKVRAVVRFAKRVKERGEKQWAGGGPRSDHLLRGMGRIGPYPHIRILEHLVEQFYRRISPAIEEAKQRCRFCINATAAEVIRFPGSEVDEASEH